MSGRLLLVGLGLCAASFLFTGERPADTFVPVPPTAEIRPVEIPAAIPAPGVSKAPSRGAPAGNAVAVGFNCLGLALAGASLIMARREPDVRMWGRRRKPFKSLFGGKKPKCPGWIRKGKIGQKDPKSGLERPAWMTMQKWESFPARDQCRSLRWWLQVHDEKGNRCFDKDEEYTIEEAVDLQLGMNARAPCRFDPAIECIMKMNLDPKYPNQQIRMSIRLPHGTGKKVRVAVFCDEADAEEVKAAGAYKWGEQLQQDIENDQFDFDVLIAKMDQMPKLAKLGRILGPRRLMPSPKSGTVVTDYKQGIADFQGGLVELRNDERMLIGCPAGRISFGRDLLIENFKAVLKGMADKRPDGAKAEFWEHVYLGSTMSPSIKIKASEFPEVEVA